MNALDSFTVGSFILAWFIQMGLHEGAHAWAAWYCGDDTAALMGKRTFDPLRHIEWTNINSLLLGVILPIYTAAHGNIPMGMAWVPVNPLRFKRMRRDWALVSAAGPLSNLALSFALLGVHHTLLRGATAPILGHLDDILWAIYATSMIYGVFNLIPLPPLDGSRILYYFLPPRWRGMVEQIEPYGMWILILVFWLGRGGALLSPIFSLFLMLWTL